MNKISNIQQTPGTLFSIFVVLMLLLPSSYQAIRALLLVVIFIKSLNLQSHKVSPKLQICWLLTLVYNVFVYFIGIINGNPGASSVITVYLIWPCLYMYFMSKKTDILYLLNLQRILVYGGILVLVVNTVFLLNAFYLNNSALTYIFEILDYKFGYYETEIAFSTRSMNSIPYFLYFTFTLYFTNGYKLLNIKKSLLYLIFVLSIILIFLSGRRAMWVIVCLFPPLFYIGMKMCGIKNNMINKLVAWTGVIAIVLYYGITLVLDLESFQDSFMTIFEFNEDESNFERLMQSKSLWNDFSQSPVFGKGLGWVSSYIRNGVSPWEYELTYNYLLASTGILGISVYGFTFLYVMKRCINVVKLNHQYASLLLPSVFGVLVMLIMNATNPYILKFDYLWMYFLPIIMLNAIYVNTQKRQV